MDEKQDNQLKALLQHYQVKPADSALIGRIVLSVQTAETTPGRRKPFMWLSNAAMMCATALFGFWLGSSYSMQPAINPSNYYDAIPIDTILFGTNNIKEVVL